MSSHRFLEALPSARSLGLLLATALALPLLSVVQAIEPARAPERRVRAFGELPLSFERNAGQAPEGYEFVARGLGYDLGLAGNRIVVALEGSRGEPTPVLGIELIGAVSTPDAKALEPTAARSHTLGPPKHVTRL